MSLEEELLSYEPGTLGELLGPRKGGELIGLQAASPELEARLVGASLAPVVEEGEGVRFVRRLRAALQIEAKQGGQVTQLESALEYPVDTFYDAFLMPAPADAVTRAQATLDRLVALKNVEALQDLLRPLLDAMMPASEPGSFLHWLETAALPALQPNGELARHAGDDGVLLVAKATAIEVEHSFRTFGAVKLMMRVDLTEQNGGRTEVFEQEVYTGGVSVAAARLAAPDLTKPEFAKVVQDWKAYFGQSMRQIYDGTGGQAVMPGDALPDTSLLSLLEDWVAEGPPGKEPERIQITEATRQRTAESLRPATDEERQALQEFLEPQLTATFVVEGYTIGFCQGDSGDDWLVLREKTSEPLLLLRADEDEGSRRHFTIDGDAWAMRNLLDWLAETLRRSAHDPEITLMLEDEDEISDEDGTRAQAQSEEEEAAEEADEDEGKPVLTVHLSDWLRFGSRYHPDEPRFDWRRPNDLLVDGAPYWDSHDEALAAPEDGELTAIRSREVPAYYRFIRRVLDPVFVGALEPRN